MPSPIDLAQNVEDAARSRPNHLFIKSPDGRDLSVSEIPFNWNAQMDIPKIARP